MRHGRVLAEFLAAVPTLGRTRTRGSLRPIAILAVDFYLLHKSSQSSTPHHGITTIWKHEPALF
jgi:hypothetical protein